jgi:PAS domain S-box-containing protein
MSRIFVVEDEAVVAMELKDRLREMGFEVCGHAAHGKAALQQIPKARPDLVLMDIKLGSDLSGLDVAERLSDLDVPVIYLTAFSDRELTERAAHSRSFAYLVKPFEPRALQANIEMVLARKRAEVALREGEAALHASRVRYQGLVAASPVGVFECDARGRCTFVNERWTAVTGLDAVTSAGEGWFCAIDADDRVAFRESLARSAETRVPFRHECRCRRPDGGIARVLAQAVVLTDGVQTTGFIGTITDLGAD